jgi:hypothetical protein
MDGQQQYKSHKTIFNLIKEGINKRIEEKNMKEQLKCHIQQLEDLLEEMHEKAQEKANLPKIEGSITSINLYSNKNSNEPKWYEYGIGTYIYGEGIVIGCFSNPQYSPYKIKCINFSNSESGLFSLFNSSQNIYFRESIKKTILNIGKILNPEVLTHNMHIGTTVFMLYPKQPIKKNPRIIKYDNRFKYYNGRSDIEITLDLL